MMSPAKTGLIAAALVGALTLTACGGATVEDTTDTPTSVAPLERAPKSSTSSTPSESAAADSAEATTSTSAEPGADGQRSQRPQRPEPQPQDQAAREIDEVPEGEVPRSAEDVNYLGELKDSKINIDGVENQLIGTAATVCDGGGNELVDATLPAVAGQLIEQGRTDRSIEDISALIQTAARNAYC